jgi:hypothetical protein
MKRVAQTVTHIDVGRGQGWRYSKGKGSQRFLKKKEVWFVCGSFSSLLDDTEFNEFCKQLTTYTNDVKGIFFFLFVSGCLFFPFDFVSRSRWKADQVPPSRNW